MTAKISPSFAPEKAAVPMSATDSEQQSVPRSIALHLLPGVLTGAAFFLLAPIVQRSYVASRKGQGWQYPVFVLLFLLTGALITLLEPVSNAISRGLLSWWPDMYNLCYGYSRRAFCLFLAARP